MYEVYIPFCCEHTRSSGGDHPTAVKPPLYYNCTIAKNPDPQTWEICIQKVSENNGPLDCGLVLILQYSSSSKHIPGMCK